MKSDMSPLSSQYFEEISSSRYRSTGPNSSKQKTVRASDLSSTDQSRRPSHRSRNNTENIKMVQVPIKYEDLLNMFQASGRYKDKSPILINMKESDINKIIKKQHNQKSGNSVQPQKSLRQSIQLSPTSLKQPVKQDYFFERLPYESSEYTTQNEITSQSDSQQFDGGSKPHLGESQAQVYAMPDIQAYPMIGTSGMKADQSRKKTPRKRSQRKKVKQKRSRRKSRSRTRKPMIGSRSMRSTSKSRGRSRRRRSPSSRPIISVRSSKSRRRPKPRATSTVIVRAKKRPVSGRRGLSPLNNRICCTPYPVCDHDCTTFTDPARLQSPSRRSSQPLLHQNANGMACNCTYCQEKLQFIQPGVCTQKKDKWTNEYAIIPKPQVNLIDPCTEFDPSIYPRADRPCIRDGRGNPLTDCIGRPLRDPVGKRFLNFNANGSVMDTNFRGNFFTGQPPLCVKCPMPGVSCAPDTTHNWWMNCGYPVKANMAPFFNSVVAAENSHRRC